MSVQTHNLTIDKKYFFSFHQDIVDLNGVYSVLAILNYEEVEALLIEPVQDLYVAVNKLDLYTSQNLASKYRTDVYYKLQSMDGEETIIFVPDSMIIDFPLSDFQEMFQYMIISEIGIINDPAELQTIVPLINQTIWKNLGIDPVSMISTYGKTYLSPQVIKEHTDTRNLNKDTTSIYTQLAQANSENVRLKAIIEKYEKIIIDFDRTNNSGSTIPTSSPNPIIASVLYANGSFELKSTVWDTPKVHHSTQWMVSKTSDFTDMVINELTTTMLVAASYVKAGVLPGKYYVKAKYGSHDVGTDTWTYSEWSPTFVYTVV